MKTNPEKSKFKIKYFFLFFAVAYVMICQSCVTMRMSPKETKLYFDTVKVAYENKTVALGRHKLHYIQTGNPKKPTLFFIHGSPGSWDAFKKYVTDSLLLSKYRMIAVDRPGFGYSDFGKAADLDMQSELLEKLVNVTDNRMPVILVGHSLGGPVVVKMASDEPNRFEHIVVLSGSLDPEAESPEIWRTVIMKKPLRYLIPGALRTSNDELWWFKSDLVALKPMLKNITTNITIVHGSKDMLVPYSNVAFMKSAFINAKKIDVITIENANHFIPWSNFDQIRDLLSTL